MADQAGPRSSTFELRDYFRILWLRKWTAFLILAIVMAGVLVLSYRQTPLYQSKVELVIPTVPVTQGVGVQTASRGVDLGTESKIAESTRVAQAVVTMLGGSLKATPQQLQHFINVAPLKNTQIMLFTAQHPNPQKAAAIAHDFAIAYLNLHVTQVLTPFLQQKTADQTKLNQDEAAIAKLPAFSPNEARTVTTERNQLQADIDTQTSDIQAITRLVGNIRAGAQTAVIQDAQVPRRPFKPNHFRDGVFAAIVGLVLGIGAAFLRDYVDDSLRGVDDVERQSGATLIGVIPHVTMSQNGKGRDRPLIMVTDPKAPATESYRTLRTNLLFMSVGGPIGRLLITSPIKGEGKSTTASNLASAMAQAGQRVLLVGSDLRRPSIHRFFGLSNRVGLSSVLSGQASLGEAIQNPGIKGLRVISGGAVPPNPAELLGSLAMKDFLEQASEVADWIILDAPPVLGLADASVLATISDAVLMVVNETTNRRILAHARDQLGKVQARVVGVVLNNFGPAFSYYYSDYYAYMSSYYYEAEPNGGAPRRERRQRRKASKAAVKAGFTSSGSPEPEIEPEPEGIGDREEPPTPDEFFLSK